MTITKPDNSAATFSFTGTPEGSQALAYDYDGLVRVSAADPPRTPFGFHAWRGHVHDLTPEEMRRDPPGDPGRMCCDVDGCTMCPPEPPCGGGVDPKKIVGPRHVAIDASATLVQEGNIATELRFDRYAEQRIPIFVSGENLPRQLTTWHNKAFGAARVVVYHVYKITDPLWTSAAHAADSSVALDTALAGRYIAIPIEPRWSNKPPAP